MIGGAGFNPYKTIKSELENFETLGILKPDFGCLGSLDLEIWESESQAKGPSLAPTKIKDPAQVGRNPRWTTTDEYLLFQR